MKCECGCGQETRLIQRSCPRRGYVKGEPHRFVAGHRPAPRYDRYTVRDCGYETPCWHWHGATNKAGYAIAWRGRVHRLVYEECRGPIPRGYVLDHLCRNRACVNPDHLEPVTRGENSRRGHTRLREDLERLRAQVVALGGVPSV